MNDADAKAALRKWSRVIRSTFAGKDESWIRCQPKDEDTSAPTPRLSLPSLLVSKTQPDGLYAYFGEGAKFCDIIAIEVCSSMQNFSDKRSRYSPTIGSLALDVRTNWLTKPLYPSEVKATWRYIGCWEEAPVADVMVPIRHVRVIYFVKDALYKNLAKKIIAQPHERYARTSSIKSFKAPKMQTFLAAISTKAQFYTRAW